MLYAVSAAIKVDEEKHHRTDERTLTDLVAGQDPDLHSRLCQSFDALRNTLLEFVFDGCSAQKFQIDFDLFVGLLHLLFPIVHRCA